MLQFEMNDLVSIEEQLKIAHIIKNDVYCCGDVIGCESCPLNKLRAKYGLTVAGCGLGYEAAIYYKPEAYKRRVELIDFFIKFAECKINATNKDTLELLRKFAIENDVVIITARQLTGNPDIDSNPQFNSKVLDLTSPESVKKYFTETELLKKEKAELFDKYDALLSKHEVLEDENKSLRRRYVNSLSELDKTKRELKELKHKFGYRTNPSIVDESYVLKLEIPKDGNDELVLYYRDENRSVWIVGWITKLGECHFARDGNNTNNAWTKWKKSGKSDFCSDIVEWRGSTYSLAIHPFSPLYEKDIYLENTTLKCGIIYNITQDKCIAYCDDKNIIRDNISNHPKRFK